jgi:hypothetical protein
MTTFRETIADTIKRRRPQLATSSIKTYVSMLFNLHKKLNGDENMDWFNNDDEIIKELNDKPLATRKTLLSALFVLTGKETYNKEMIDACKKMHQINSENKKNEKQDEGWMTPEQIQTIYDGLEEKVKAMFSKKLLASYEVIVQYVLLGCLGGVSGLPPRRSMDYVEMKVRNYNPKEDNFYKNGVFVFNRYKTFKTYGTQTIDVKEHAPEFNKLLMKWAKVNPTDYLIFSSSQEKMSSSQISRYLNKILDKPTSTNILRHIYISSRFGKENQDMEEVAKDMAHSLTQQSEYIKR